jgi:hypothetical protein
VRRARSTENQFSLILVVVVVVAISASDATVVAIVYTAEGTVDAANNTVFPLNVPEGVDTNFLPRHAYHYSGSTKVLRGPLRHY